MTLTISKVGRAVAALLSLPIKSDGGACLEDFRNKVVFVSSFSVSQQDMFESALRVTGTRKEDWTITNEAVQARFSSGLKDVSEGRREGFAKLISRAFFPDGGGNVEHKTLNDVLGLPKEMIDNATRAAIERSKISH
jgi:hypothetical protein